MAARRIAAAALAAALAAAAAEAADSAVILMYHRFGEDRYRSTNIRLDQFEAHLAELTGGGYAVLPLERVVDSLRRGVPLPDRTVAVTVDDAYRSVFTEGWPRFRRAGIPVTLFVATEPIDRGLPGYMSWDEVREMARAGAGIGHHTVTHLHMADHPAGRNRDEIARASARFEAELGFRPTLFAYPYGEAGLDVMGVVEAAGFAAAFGQHSGVATSGAGFAYLPRFAINESYGGIARLRQILNALPLDVRGFEPADPLIRGANPPPVRFTVEGAGDGLDRLACYVSGEDGVTVENLGGRRVRLLLKRPLPPGRTRLNCTLPAESGRWRWFGTQFYRAG